MTSFGSRFFSASLFVIASGTLSTSSARGIIPLALAMCFAALFPTVLADPVQADCNATAIACAFALASRRVLPEASHALASYNHGTTTQETKTTSAITAWAEKATEKQSISEPIFVPPPGLKSGRLQISIWRWRLKC